jgi:hypothetical protein
MVTRADNAINPQSRKLPAEVDLPNSADPSISRSRVAQNSPGNVTKPGPVAAFINLLLPLTLKYEIDAWGKIRRMVEPAKARAQSSAPDLRFRRLPPEAVMAHLNLSGSEVRSILSKNSQLSPVSLHSLPRLYCKMRPRHVCRIRSLEFTPLPRNLVWAA